jgi:hypothetical protein
MYDLIGDIHGHAGALVELLEHLGYQHTDSGYCHPSRKVIFLGDFIDRGEHLAEHKKLLSIVMPMVQNGHALAVMGNHEFNALAYHTEVNGLFLRPHTEKNRKQHKAFLNEFDEDLEAKNEVLDFFYELPMWLELDDLRVVHACWDYDAVEFLAKRREGSRMTPDLLVSASTEGTAEFKAVETLLKGHEVALPDGVSFADKDGNVREWIRVQWWKLEATALGDIALPFGIEIGDAANLPVPQGIPKYDASDKPCFIGHYWLSGDPEPLAPNVACLDYSVAKNGKLVAYRWSGEAVLEKDNFVFAT